MRERKCDKEKEEKKENEGKKMKENVTTEEGEGRSEQKQGIIKSNPRSSYQSGCCLKNSPISIANLSLRPSFLSPIHQSYSAWILVLIKSIGAVATAATVPAMKPPTF
eukprot:765157-Hanusia_phi.AAC.3